MNKKAEAILLELLAEIVGSLNIYSRKKEDLLQKLIDEIRKELT